MDSFREVYDEVRRVINKESFAGPIGDLQPKLKRLLQWSPDVNGAGVLAEVRKALKGDKNKTSAQKIMEYGKWNAKFGHSRSNKRVAALKMLQHFYLWRQRGQ